MNYFDHPEAALRYAKYRPDYHELVMKQIRRFLQFKHKLPLGLDIACGTGLSSKALGLISEKVIACDGSSHMLHHAIANEHISYFLKDENQLEFDENSFDIISIASGIHWMDTKKIFQTCENLLKPKAWLLIYDHRILHEQTFLKGWYEDYFLQEYPAPARNKTEVQTELSEHLAFIKEEKFVHEISFQTESFVQYLCTQSNVINAVLSGKKSYTEIENQLRNELLKISGDLESTFPVQFQYNYQLIRKI